MGLINLDKCYGQLICPRCSSSLLVENASFRCSSETCPNSTTPFPIIRDKPVIIDFDASVVSLEDVLSTSGASLIRRFTYPRLRRLFQAVNNPRNRRTEENITQMLDFLRSHSNHSSKPLTLVIGGGTMGHGTEELYAAEDIHTLAFDIYWSPVIQLLADGQRIPLADSSVDGVLIQAVLEHVLEPNTVVQEIHRVLRSGGVVYSETPFTQQVHEGAFDFTRFSDSGHRYLFRDFELISSGEVAGPGTQLVWSIEHFMRALFRSRAAGYLARLSTFWIGRLDRFLDPQFSIDGASSVYFLGRKSMSRMSAHDVISYYQGAQRG